MLRDRKMKKIKNDNEFKLWLAEYMIARAGRKELQQLYDAFKMGFTVQSVIALADNYERSQKNAGH